MDAGCPQDPPSPPEGCPVGASPSAAQAESPPPPPRALSSMQVAEWSLCVSGMMGMQWTDYGPGLLVGSGGAFGRWEEEWGAGGVS